MYVYLDVIVDQLYSSPAPINTTIIVSGDIF
jgi:hypothetical protein